MIVDAPAVRHPFTPRKVVLISGLSDPRGCALSNVQQEFLAALPIEESAKIYRNFPYVAGAEIESPQPLPVACWNNLRQFAMMGRGRYRAALKRHWQALAASTNELTIITLSCGLEIANQCLTGEEASSPAIALFAFGPVAWRRPTVPHLLVRGDGDTVSLPFFRRVDVVLTGVGHMSYWQHPEVSRILCEHLCGNTLTSSAADITSRNQ